MRSYFIGWSKITPLNVTAPGQDGNEEETLTFRWPDWRQVTDRAELWETVGFGTAVVLGTIDCLIAFYLF